MAFTNNWVGAVDESSAWVRANVDGIDGELFVSTNSDMSAETSAGTGSSSNGIVSVRATGLTADTTYYFQMHESEGGVGPIGRFHTHGAQGQPYSFSFIAMGDAGLDPATPGTGTVLAADRMSNHAVFDTIRTGWDPLFGLHLGDMHYYDLGSGAHGISGGASLSNYRRAYDDVLTQPRQHELYYRVPLTYVWDDHDFGPNNSDGTHSGKTNAAQVYRERVPHYTLPEASGPIYQSWQIGRVLFIANDVRYNRDPNDDPQSSSKTMLGQAQKDWMSNLLSTSSAEFLVWCMPKPFPSLPGGGGDSWGRFSHERAELMTMFRDLGWVDRMMVLSADMHGLALDSGGAWERIDGMRGPAASWVCASLDASPSNPVDWWDQGNQGGRNQYAQIEVDDRGDTIRVVSSGWAGTSRWQETTTFSRQAVVTVPLLGLDYSQGHVSPPFEPTEDDQQLRNDVTAKRDGGSSARETKDTGPLSVQVPPDGVGVYDESVTLNVAADNQLSDQAGWRVHLGTVDEPRYPEVTVNLARNQGLQSAVGAVESGDRFTIANPPPWLPPGTVELIAQGYEERLTAFEWTWTANTSPAQPWKVGVLGDDTLGRLDTSGSQLGEDIGDADTAFQVQITAGPVWITDAGLPGDFPFDVEVGGEVLRVTGVGAESSGFQSFTATRSINGVTKSHAAGAAVSLAQPLILAL